MTMNLNRVYAAALKKRAVALLTPEAEQAAMQPQAPPSLGASPAGAGPMGGAQQQASPTPAGVGMGASQPPVPGLPPEALQDPQFVQWLAQYQVQLDPATGTLYGPDGQPMPPEAGMAAYQAYMEEMAGGQQQQGAAPQGGAPQDGAADAEFMQFLEQAMGIVPDLNTGVFVDAQGNQVPDQQLAEMYEAFNQQRETLMQEGQQVPGEALQPEAAAAQPGVGGVAEEQLAGSAGMGPEGMTQLQSMIDASIQGYTVQIEKKMETLIDKLDTLKLAIEAMRDTNDKRTEADINEAKQLREELAAELNPTINKTASTQRPAQLRPLNLFDMLKKVK